MAVSLRVVSLNERIIHYDIVSLPDLLSKMPPLSTDTRPGWYYRGQKMNPDWTLTPSIYRDFRDTASVTSKDDWLTFEQRLLRRFKSEALPYLSFVPRADLEWLMVGQHHGLPTRLLDFTKSLLIGLFFALEDEGAEDRIVWATEALPFGMPDDVVPLVELFEDLKGASIIFPTHVTPRITAQKGVFMIAPTPDNRAFVPLEERRGAAMIRYRIPAEYRGNILEDLKRAGIDYQTIYPDLAGVVKHIKSQIGKE